MQGSRRCEVENLKWSGGCLDKGVRSGPVEPSGTKHRVGRGRSGGNNNMNHASEGWAGTANKVLLESIILPPIFFSQWRCAPKFRSEWWLATASGSQAHARVPVQRPSPVFCLQRCPSTCEAEQYLQRLFRPVVGN